MFRTIGKVVVLPLAALAGFFASTMLLGVLMGVVTASGLVPLELALRLDPYSGIIGVAGATIAVGWVINR